MPTILITGTSSGIGRTTVEYFSKKGWNVAATMRSPEKETHLHTLPNVRVYRLDVTDIPSIQQAIRDVLRDFGSLDAICNNAGYGAVGVFEASSPEQMQHQFDTNVFGLMNVVREVLPYFRQQRKGTIINVSSMGGLLTFPLYSAYHATKWAVEGFSESLQFELRPFNIRVKLIEPGAIKTEFYARTEPILKKDGLTAYDAYERVTFANTQAAGAKAPSTEIVAKEIFRAANDSSFKLRYPVSLQAKMLLLLRKFLPNGLFNMMVRSQVEKGFKG